MGKREHTRKFPLSRTLVTDKHWIGNSVEAFGFVTSVDLEPFEITDVARFRGVLDAEIDKAGRLNSIVIATDRFPGWGILSVMTSHFRFVRSHHEIIGRVALASDERCLLAVARLAKHFVAAEIKGFEPGASEEAHRWAAGA